ncbi:MAG: hypothetical protein OEV44_06285, partial [Spirochaetota bacterium]|nr:hypothetical protein [Spirochaetota bacterium]
KNTKYITYKFLHVQTKQNNKRVNNFLTPYSIDAKLIMHNKKQYSLGYFKKVEKYQNNVLINISYYDVNENFEYRLRVIIFYSKQNISGYKIRRFNKDSIQEEYYDGSRRWINYFNMSERLESSFYYPEGTDRFIFSVYFYNKKKLKNDLLVKEDYYFDVDKKLLNKVYKSLLNKKLNKLKELFVQIVKGKKILLLEHNSLEIQRERWGKNIQFLKSMIVGGIENENHFRRETFWYYQKNGLIKKVEYYRDDIKNNLRKIEYYDEQGDVDRVENFNRKGEMIFDKD